MGTARLLWLLSAMTVLQQVRCWNICVPSRVTAVEGSCVVVPCHTEPHNRVIWYQYHKIHYPVVYNRHKPEEVEHQFRGRTSLLGEATEGNCSLKIDDVSRADNNLQLYVWINPDSKPTQRFYDQTVTIHVEITVPVISVKQPIVEGGFFEAKCDFLNYCPFSPSSLQWTKSPFFDNLTMLDVIPKPQGLWLYTQTLRATATHEMNNTEIRCSANFRTLIKESKTITLNILYKPISVMLILEKKEMMEGDSITVECSASSNPQPHMYTWIRRQMGNTDETNSAQRRMSFHNITRRTSLSCRAQNNIGEGKSEWMDLPVQYVPVILTESSCSLMGDQIKYRCHVEAFPKPSVSWIIDGNYSLPSLPTTISPTKKNVVSMEILVPLKHQLNVSCIAWNQFGSDTKQLVLNCSSKLSLLIWLISVGLILLLGCVMLWKIHLIRKRSQNQERPEEDAEDRLSCVYDNDYQEDMRSVELQQYQNFQTPHHRAAESLPAKGGNSSMEIYLNYITQNTHC